VGDAGGGLMSAGAMDVEAWTMTSGTDETGLVVATIIHDLRNPLAAILGYTQIAAWSLSRSAHGSCPEAERGLAEIETTARRMARMLDDLLEATAQAASGSAGRDEVKDLRALLDRAASQVELATGQQRIHLQLPPIAVYCSWDPGKVTRAVVNVMENAPKYRPEGGVVVVAVSHDDGEVTIAVRDEGIGIPGADLDHIFDAYVRGSNTGYRFEGSGLGLASARTLIESQGGSIVIASVEGLGTRVTIRLPMSRARD
jgi:two-component system OmpR family sensor kinase